MHTLSMPWSATVPATRLDSHGMGAHNAVRHADRVEQEVKDAEQGARLDEFLSGVERRAYRMAYIASGNREDALDLVQEAMCKLVEKYAHKSANDWGPLFHRILQSKIRDHYRRSGVRNRFLVWLGGADDQRENELEQHADRASGRPAEMTESAFAMRELDAALHRLPLRQQQAFLLRAWEGLSTEETAAAMGCSTGSVKTHYSRAVHSLRDQLGEHRDD